MKNFILILSFFFLISNPTFGQEAIQSKIEYIKKESINGKLDFSKNLENGKLYLVDGVAYNKKTYAILLWAKAISELGINKSKTVVTLWEEIHHRKIAKPEKKALNKGLKL